jgi:hypothetical protein
MSAHKWTFILLFLANTVLFAPVLVPSRSHV